jgi:translation initiation factor 6
MRVIREDIFGTPFIGLYAIATEKSVFLPAGFFKKRSGERFTEALQAPVRFISVYGSQMIGIFAAANSNCLLVPSISEAPRGIGNVAEISDRMTALGNVILANDNGAIISPEFSRKAEEEIRDGLGVEVVRGTIAGNDLVGSSAIVTNRGALVHPRATEKEIEILKSVLKISAVEVGSLNRGSDFVGSSAIANSKGVAVGTLTTPIEITRLEDALQ